MADKKHVNGAAKKRGRPRKDAATNGAAKVTNGSNGIGHLNTLIQVGIAQGKDVALAGKDPYAVIAAAAAKHGAARGKPRPIAKVPGSPKFKIVNVTPELAAEWLALNVGNQRPLSAAAVAQYARDMSAGAWRVTHQGIAFNVHGQLVDGQHRLHAVIVSGQTVPMVVTTGLELEFDDPLDQGRERTLGHMLHKEVREVALVRQLTALEAGSPSKRARMSLAEMQAATARHAKTLELVWPAFRKLHAGVLAGIAWALPLDRVRVLKFAEQVLNGEMLKRGQPAYALRAWLSKEGTENGYKFTLATLNAARAMLMGEDLANLYTTPAGYRWICQRRRAEKVPHTPDAKTVEPLGSYDTTAIKKKRAESKQLTLAGDDA